MSSAASSSINILIQGKLYKRRNGLTKHIDGKPTWVYRYFTLKSDGVLSYYESPVPIGSDNEEVPRNSVNLSVVPFELHREPSIEAAPTKFAFMVQFNKDVKWKLCAELDADHKAWCLELDRFLPYSLSTHYGLAPAAGMRIDVDSEIQSMRDSVVNSPAHKSSAGAGAGAGAGAAAAVDSRAPRDRDYESSPQRGVGAGAGAATAVGLSRSLSSKGKPKGKVLKLTRAANSEGLFDVTMLETLFAAVCVNYSLYMAYMYHHGRFASTAFPSDVCLSLQDLPLPAALSGAARSWAWILPSLPLPLPSSGSVVALLYACVGNAVLLVTLRLRYARYMQANAEKLELVAKLEALASSSSSSSSLPSAERERNRSASKPLLAHANSASAVAAEVFHLVNDTASASASASTTASGSALSSSADAVTQPAATGTAVTFEDLTAADGELTVVDDKPFIGGNPVPGYSLQRVTTPQRQSPPHSWSRFDHEEFHVRIGPNYSWNKKKAPSAHPLYDVFAVDVFSAAKRVDHAASRFAIPEKWASINTGHAFVPPVFVVQIQIPADPPSFFHSTDDGPGWSICMFFGITDDTLAQLKDMSTASPAVRLWAKWCELAEQDKNWRARFKFIPACSNLVELGVYQSIADYNAKPILIRKTGTLFRGPPSKPGEAASNPKYMEFDMHIHKFDTVAKKSIHFMTAMCKDMFMQIGFVIEGRDDDELPEVLFGACAINRPQEASCESIFD